MVYNFTMPLIIGDLVEHVQVFGSFNPNGQYFVESVFFNDKPILPDLTMRQMDAIEQAAEENYTSELLIYMRDCGWNQPMREAI